MFNRAEKKKKFIEKFAECGNLGGAGQGLVTRTAVFRWRRKDPEFAAALAEAAAAYVEKLEGEADRRAVDGVERGIYFRGTLIATERDYSDTLLMFRLRGLAPEKYRERQEVTGPNGGPQEVVIRVVYDNEPTAGIESPAALPPPEAD